MSEAGACIDGRLADELAVTLKAKLQDALNHPTRRSILRVLHRRQESRSVAALLGELPSLRRAEVTYHLQVLQACGAVLADGTRPPARGGDVLYRSELASDTTVSEVLRATERQDRKRRRVTKGSHSSSRLTMFRVPRPERSIRLSNLLGRKTDREE